MQAYKQKLHKYREQIRMNYRERIKAENRPWGELPSVIIELPSRIENQSWEHFDQLLDSITSQDIALVTEELDSYIHNQYRNHFVKIQMTEQIQATTLNLLRMVLRLRIADNSQFRDALTMLKNSYQAHLSNLGKRQPLQVIFKILKQLVIFTQQQSPTNSHVEPSFQISQQNLQQLSNIVCKMTLYKSHKLINIQCQNKQLFNNYRIYYVCLLSGNHIDFKDYIKGGNIEELFYLIDDSLKHKEHYEIAVSIKCILKLLRVSSQSTNQSIQTNGICKALQTLLIDGLQAAQQSYQFQKQSILCKDYNYQFKGDFFEQLLVLMCDCDIDTLIKSIQLLGQLFQESDNYIQAVSKTTNQNVIKQDEANQSLKSNVVYLRQEQFRTYQELFFSLMEHLCTQIREKTFWMLSNIIGSERFFYSYGLAFLKFIYQKDNLNQQKDYLNIQNQILICILNYMCNLQLESRALQHLVQIQSIQEQKQTQGLKIGKNGSNCFIFCLQTIILTLQQIFHTSYSKANQTLLSSPVYLNFLQRSAYALYVLLTLTKQQYNQEQYQIVMYQIGKAQLLPLFQQFLLGQTDYSSSMRPVYSSIEQILKHLQLSKQNL